MTTMVTADRRILGLFAEILEYPGARLARAVQECEALVASRNAEAGALLGRFRAFVEEAPLARLEEVYTGTFDLDAACHPYVGYHLFGESYKRSVFLLGLKERYTARGFAAGSELPDHVAVLLRFLATTDDAGLAAELVGEALLPALDRMTGTGEGQSPKEYQRVLQALRLVLQREPCPAGLP